MAIFSYVARDQAGRTRTGRIKGKSADEVASKLKAMGLSVVRVETVGGRGIRLPFFGGVSTKDLAIFSRQFAVMIEAGIPIVQALDILSEQTQKRRFRDVIRRVKEDVEGGKTLAESMKSHPKIFPHMLVQMVAVGETGGALGNTLKEVAAYYEKMDSLKRKIKAAAAYPMVIFVVLIAVTTFLLVFIIPRFAQLYADVGAKLPTPTMIVIGISNILKRFFI
ncbi:type II secretion system F family protein, partial [Thermococci archaeon]